MRPLFSLNNVVAILMLCYAGAIAATPNGGAVSYLHDHTFFTPPLVVGMFVLCAVLIPILRPTAAGMSVLTAPILLYGVASLMYFFTLTSGAFAAVVSHLGLWLVIQAALYDRTRRPC